MKTITSAINDGDFSGAIAIMSYVAPGDTKMETALETCQAKAKDLADAVAAALAIADGR